MQNGAIPSTLGAMHSSLVRIVLIVVIILAAAGAMVWLERTPINRLANILGITVTLSDISEETPEPSVPPLSDRVPALSLGTVAIQTLQGSNLVQIGAGTAVSSDGLIVTTAAGAPYGTGTYSYRVITSRGVTAVARRVAYDTQNALVLLKAELTDPGTVPFTALVPRAGDTWTAISATVARSAYAPVILPAAVVSATAENDVNFSIDRAFLGQLAGARLVDRTGVTAGLLKNAGTLGIIPASAVNAFVTRYLDSIRGR